MFVAQPLALLPGTAKDSELCVNSTDVSARFKAITWVFVGLGCHIVMLLLLLLH